MTPHPAKTCAVIVLGDQDTGNRADVLATQAAEHHAVVTEIHTFDAEETRCTDDLSDVEAVTTALGRAIATKNPIWIPFPGEDFGGDHQLRWICLVLQHRGTNLLLGQRLWPCPTEGGVNPIDYALRHEVHTVYELDHAALAAAAATDLGLDQEIERALAARIPGPSDPDPQPVPRLTLMPPVPAKIIEQLESRFGPGPTLPHPRRDWVHRYPDLKAYATWLVSGCGLTQATAADILNAAGHRTPHGRPWGQATISALINGRYRPTAAG